MDSQIRLIEGAFQGQQGTVHKFRNKQVYAVKNGSTLVGSEHWIHIYRHSWPT